MHSAATFLIPHAGQCTLLIAQAKANKCLVVFNSYSLITHHLKPFGRILVQSCFIFSCHFRIYDDWAILDTFEHVENNPMAPETENISLMAAELV